MNRYAMLDFETLSLRTNAVILCAGVVVFDDAFNIESETRFDFPLEEQQSMGRDISIDTLRFWSKQTNFKDALQSFEKEGPLFSHVHDLLYRLSSTRIEHVWTNGNKDVEWLESLAYATERESMLPKYSSFREFRTVRELARSHGYIGKPVNFDYTLHDPVSDAKWQVHELKGCFEYLGLSLNPNNEPDMP